MGWEEKRESPAIGCIKSIRSSTRVKEFDLAKSSSEPGGSNRKILLFKRFFQIDGAVFNHL